MKRGVGSVGRPSGRGVSNLRGVAEGHLVRVHVRAGSRSPKALCCGALDATESVCVRQPSRGPLPENPSPVPDGGVYVFFFFFNCGILAQSSQTTVREPCHLQWLLRKHSWGRVAHAAQKFRPSEF